VAAMRCNDIIERIDLGIKFLENPLTVVAILTEGDGLTRFRRLVKLNSERAAAIIALGGVRDFLVRACQWESAAVSSSTWPQ
jgi:hypothetical protein